MVHINIEPKSRNSIMLWLLLGIGIIAVLFFLTRWLNEQEPNSAASTITTITSTSSHAANDDWNKIKFNAPAANYNEITIREITVRGTNNYAIYSIKEEVLFVKDKNTLHSDAAKVLQQIANSIEQRYTNGIIRIYGHVNAVGSNENAKQLTQQRVETVHNWILQNGNVPTDHISINPLKETQPGASYQVNQNHENHCIDIVARRPS